MKTNIITLLLALCLSASVAFGQGTKYITLEEIPPYYLNVDNYSWITDYNVGGMTSTGYHYVKGPYIYTGNCGTFADYFLFGYLPDTTVTVIGIAYGAIEPYVQTGAALDTIWNENTINTFYNQWVGELYIPGGGGHDYMTHSARMAYGAKDKESIKVMQNTISPVPTPVRRFVIEGFFDQPITLSDSFYVGTIYYADSITSTEYQHDSTCWSLVNAYYEEHYGPGPTPTTFGPLGYFPPYDYPLRHLVYRDGDCGVWHDTTLYLIAMIWPIIQLNGDVCDEVENLEATQIGGDALYVTWDAGVNHSRWQVSYGPAGTPPGIGTVVETSVPQTLLTGLPEGTCEVYVRSYCDLARGKWSPWSDAVSVNIGIQDTPQADVPLAVYPNPTKGTFRIEAEATITAVELYDLSGSAVLSLPVNNTGMGIDISTLPEGTYILAAHTASGLATRRIVKQ